MIAARSPRRSARRGRAGSWAAVLRAAAVAVTLGGMVASAAIARAWHDTVTRQREERLDRLAATRMVAVGTALRHYENALQAQRSLWLASSTVTRDEFRTFARTLALEHSYPGLQGIGWRTPVPADRADRFVRDARADGAPDFTIRPPGRRPVYYVTLYNEPAGRFGSTWGSTPTPAPASWPGSRRLATAGGRP